MTAKTAKTAKTAETAETAETAKTAKTEKVLNTTPAPKVRKVVPVKVQELPEARDNYVTSVDAELSAVKKTYGAGSIYAALLTQKFGCGWQKIAVTPKKELSGNAVKTREAIDAEKKTLRTMLKANDVPTNQLDMPWLRVRKVAAEIEQGLRYETDGSPIPGKRAPKGASNKRDIVARAKEDLSALFKALHVTTDKPAKAAQAERFVQQALLALGVDTATLVKVGA